MQIFLEGESPTLNKGTSLKLAIVETLNNLVIWTTRWKGDFKFVKALKNVIYI